MLPEASPGDLFFDIEGDPFVEPGGLEYLLGWAFAGDDEKLRYEHRWGLDRAGERAAFEAFVDFAMERWRRWPGMHVYHFGVYETAALKRVMCRYATHEDELDRLLRGGRFVDLHQVLRQGVRCSVERYGLKELEPFHGFARGLEQSSGSSTRPGRCRWRTCSRWRSRPRTSSNPNRLNVATSRAQCAVVLVGNPRLLEPECRTVEQMRWANGLCRFGEVGRLVPQSEVVFGSET